MGRAEEEKNISAHSGSSSKIGEGGLLYGWLVSRAAADLALAQALASSKLQRSEQLKHFEKSLLEQIRTLQDRASTVGTAKTSSEWEDQLGKFFEQLVHLERLAGVTPDLAAQTPHRMRTLEEQITHAEQSTLSEIANLKSKIDQVATAPILNRIAGLEEKFTAALDTLARRDAELLGVREQLTTLASRLAELAQQWKTQGLPGQATANPSSDTRDDGDSGLAAMSDRPQTSSESLAPALTALEVEPKTLLRSYYAETSDSQEQKKQLQQRISADIERVRAELRKRAGVAR